MVGIGRRDRGRWRSAAQDGTETQEEQDLFYRRNKRFDYSGKQDQVAVRSAGISSYLRLHDRELIAAVSGQDSGARGCRCGLRAGGSERYI